MATKGVPIDFKKKYITKEGNKVLKFKKTSCTVYPIKALEMNCIGKKFWCHYTFDGFFEEGKETPDYDLYLDEEQK